MPRPPIAVLITLIAVGLGAGIFLVLLDGEERGGEGEPAPSSFRFEVLTWTCEQEAVVSAEGNIEPRGEFCFVALNVRNAAKRAGALDPSCQYLVDGAGKLYGVRLDVLALDAQARAGFGKVIGPGRLVEDAALYYDVPKGTRPVALELHDRCGQRGKRVALEPALEGADY